MNHAADQTVYPLLTDTLYLQMHSSILSAPVFSVVLSVPHAIQDDIHFWFWYDPFAHASHRLSEARRK